MLIWWYSAQTIPESETVKNGCPICEPVKSCTNQGTVPLVFHIVPHTTVAARGSAIGRPQSPNP